MRALPLWQPYATLVASGAKRIETRSWQVPYSVLGTRVAVHATKGGLSQRDLFALLDLPVFATELCLALDLAPNTSPAGISRALPRGAIVATVKLARSSEITADRAADLKLTHPVEHAYGDYTPGRFAWVLEDVQALPRPVECRGHQGIFEVPAETAATLVVAERGQESLFA